MNSFDTLVGRGNSGSRMLFKKRERERERGACAWRGIALSEISESD